VYNPRVTDETTLSRDEDVDTASTEDGPRETRSWVEIYEPEGTRGTWRDLPGLVGASIRLAWNAGRRELIVTTILSLVAALAVGAQVLAGQVAIDAVVGATGDLTAIIPALALVIGVTVLIAVIQTIETEQTRVLGELTSRRALDRVIDVSTSVDLLAFEDPTFHDRLRRAESQGQYRGLEVVQGLLGIVGASATVLTLLVALAALQPLLLPFALVGYLPLWIVAARNTREFYSFMFGFTPNERQRSYLSGLMLSRRAAKELRAFQLAPFLRRRYDRLYDERIDELRRMARRRTIRGFLGALLSVAAMAAALAMLAWLLVNERMDVAAAGAAVFALYQLTTQLRTLLYSASALYESALFVRDYTSFLELERPSAEFTQEQRRPFVGVRLEDVSFSYPGTPRPAVDAVSLELAPAEVIALVGENGSGKTTLAKLIAGLYRPERGRILWGGTDVTTLEGAELRAQTAVIFQDFEQYLLSARENVGLGRHEAIDDLDRIVEAATRADADEFVRRLPDGYETMLGREFMGGYDLSVGQWQRLALGRAFFRDASLVILDEPTAALDARAESRLFDRMRDLLEGRAAVLISHRFSTVRSADRIYVLHRGRLEEHGTHEELMARGGRYAELFSLQAAAYLDSRLGVSPPRSRT
jgi:ATP-binding cassette subfamily B protein